MLLERGVPADMEGSWKRWKEWSEHEQPETQPLPQEWKRLSGFRQLMIMRALRPDRIVLFGTHRYASANG